jgi:uncharacterized protein YaaQ
METLYRKVKRGKKTVYLEANTDFGHSLPDGIWSLTRGVGGSSASNIAMRIAKLPQPVDIPRYISLFQLRDRVIKGMKEINATVYNVSLFDFVENVIDTFYKAIHEKEYTEERKQILKMQSMAHYKIRDCRETFLGGFDVEVYDNTGEVIKEKCRSFPTRSKSSNEESLKKAKEYVAFLLEEISL